VKGKSESRVCQSEGYIKVKGNSGKIETWAADICSATDVCVSLSCYFKSFSAPSHYCPTINGCSS